MSYIYAFRFENGGTYCAAWSDYMLSIEDTIIGAAEGEEILKNDVGKYRRTIVYRVIVVKCMTDERAVEFKLKTSDLSNFIFHQKLI